VVGRVGGFEDGQRASGQRAGGGRITKIAQDQGEVVQADADGGMVGPLCGFGDGQGSFSERAGGGPIAETI